MWPDKTSPAGKRYAHTKQDVVARGRRALETLSRRSEKLVFIVSHSGFLRVGVTTYWYYNSDYRVFDFDAEAGGVNGLRQAESTLSGGLGLSWTERAALGEDLPDENDVTQEAVI